MSPPSQKPIFATLQVFSHQRRAPHICKPFGVCVSLILFISIHYIFQFLLVFCSLCLPSIVFFHFWNTNFNTHGIQSDPWQLHRNAYSLFHIIESRRHWYTKSDTKWTIMKGQPSTFHIIFLITPHHIRKSVYFLSFASIVFTRKWISLWSICLCATNSIGMLLWNSIFSHFLCLVLSFNFFLAIKAALIYSIHGNPFFLFATFFYGVFVFIQTFVQAQNWISALLIFNSIISDHASMNWSRWNIFDINQA